MHGKLSTLFKMPAERENRRDRQVMYVTQFTSPVLIELPADLQARCDRADTTMSFLVDKQLMYIVTTTVVFAHEYVLTDLCRVASHCYKCLIDIQWPIR